MKLRISSCIEAISNRVFLTIHVKIPEFIAKYGLRSGSGAGKADPGPAPRGVPPGTEERRLPTTAAGEASKGSNSSGRAAAPRLHAAPDSKPPALPLSWKILTTLPRLLPSQYYASQEHILTQTWLPLRFPSCQNVKEEPLHRRISIPTASRHP